MTKKNQRKFINSLRKRIGRGSKTLVLFTHESGEKMVKIITKKLFLVV